ncbi:MAG: GAF domain-containing sensor histidine kinase [Gammaproteobacteria bacterium]|nr:GAF domain-containing sensor histidine kinase [Gammaproteobacteria bacterium]
MASRSPLESLHEAIATFNRQLPLEKIGEQVLTLLDERLGYKRGNITLIDPETGNTRLLAHARMGLDDESFRREFARVARIIEAGEGTTCWVARHGVPRRIGDASTDPHYHPTDPAIRSGMAVPMEFAGRTIGAINVESDRPNAFSEEDEQLLSVIATETAYAVENARLHESLRRHRDELQALAFRIIRLQEEERSRIAQDLHDQLGQDLTVLGLKIGEIQEEFSSPPGLPEAMSNLLRDIGNISDFIRNMSRNLRPPSLDLIGLDAAIAQHVQEFEKHAGITTHFESRDIPAGVQIEPSTAVFRIVQEALTNAARHAEASRVDVSLEYSADNLVVRVRDNGKGFRWHDLSPHVSMGLVGMRERARALGGHVEIRGVPGEGTEISATVPLAVKK